MVGTIVISAVVVWIGVVGKVVGSDDKLDANSVVVGTIVVVSVVVGIRDVLIETVSVVEILKLVAAVVKGDVLVLIGLLIIVVENAELLSVVVRGNVVDSTIVVGIGVVAKETGKVDEIWTGKVVVSGVVVWICVVGIVEVDAKLLSVDERKVVVVSSVVVGIGVVAKETGKSDEIWTGEVVVKGAFVVWKVLIETLLVSVTGVEVEVEVEVSSIIVVVLIDDVVEDDVEIDCEEQS